MTNSVAERIRGFIVETFPSARRPDFSNDDPLIEKGILDSMGVLEVVAFIEQQFQVTISDDDLQPDNFETISRLTSFVTGKMPEALEKRAEVKPWTS